MARHGVDISKWQGDIDFTKLKDGIDFIILREGYRKHVDPRFYEYVSQAQENNIKIAGIYHFCYALNVQDALDEAEICISHIKEAGIDNNITVFYDFEYGTIDDAKTHGVTLGKSECIAFTETFCERVKELGYRPGVYSNIDYYKRMYDPELLDRYIFWLADYTGEPNYECDFHQYTSSGRVNGIRGNVDMNWCYNEELLNDPVSPEEDKGWRKDDHGWWYQYKKGVYPKNEWVYLSEKTGGTEGWYLFNEDGYMLTGYTEFNGKAYYLSEKQDNREGQCMCTNNLGELIYAPYDFEYNRYVI